MAAHETESLWDFARGKLPRDAAERVAAHLALCTACAVALDEMKGAQQFLAPPPVARLPDAKWRRIDAAVLEMAERELAKSRGFSFFGIPRPALAGALVAAGIAAVVLFWPKPQPAFPGGSLPPLAERTGPSVEVPPPPVPSGGSPRVLVASARRAHGQGATLAARAQLSEGAQVATEAQGELWLTLPDGSRAGLMGGGQLRLEHATDKQVRLHVEKGTLLIAAAHRAERPFAIRVGDVDVQVVGTRFLVERDDAAVVVAVEDGAVETRFDGASRRIAAGESVRFEHGSSSARSLDSSERVMLARLEAPVHASRGVNEPAESVTPDIPSQPEPPQTQAAQPVQTDVEVPSQPAPAVGSSENDFNTPPDSISVVHPRTAPDAGPPPRPKGLLPSAPWPPVSGPDIRTATPVGSDPSRAEVDRIQHLADVKDYARALQEADGWLQGGRDPKLRHAVLVTKARCLRKLGRNAEADAVDAQQ